MGLWDVLKEMSLRFYREGVFDLSAQLAYYFLLSVFPFLLVVITLLGFLPISPENILEFIKPYAPAHTHQLIKNTLISIIGVERRNLLSFSILVTLWLTYIGIQSIIRMLNRTFSTDESRPFMYRVIEGALLMLGLFIAVIVTLLLPVFGEILRGFFLPELGLSAWSTSLWSLFRWVLSGIVLFLVFFCLYFFAPNVRLQPAEAAPGAFFATIGWQLISLGFAFYVTLGNYSLIYGNLGGLIILIVWFYLSAMILIMGGQLNAILYENRIRSLGTR
ncbi:YihY/virulence factor BrkB family protein [Marininema halotolerans]|uniref:Membrane protein n=1 Tax=Marininema halotolerans TaxID=1155944 RepID=A0A1I6TPC8_9BACL|nr:YihY/virulence factor BrkB family protein [Marininema halotolerans]SFS90827.1 membrane protein [Marininema halotolerans]